jgi:hypothetical protein
MPSQWQKHKRKKLHPFEAEGTVNDAAGMALLSSEIHVTDFG